MPNRACGINFPVFSLRTKNSMGTGEFLDLIPMIDWAKDAGFKWIQLLPIHDTQMEPNEHDVHPYIILSTFSLHPLYLHVDSLMKGYEEELFPIHKELDHPKLDYLQTLKVKQKILKLLYPHRKQRDLSTKEYQTFFRNNQEHLEAYAAFSALRDHFKTGDFRQWGHYAKYSPEILEEIKKKFDLEFFYFVQFHLHQQLKKVCSYAKEKGLQLKGDFSMGVAQNSVTAWRYPQYFRWEYTMGAPPDFYNDQGQDWGFPAYDWESMQKDNHRWLQSRLQWMEQYFDAIRIDHVLGYFRLWEVPKDEDCGLMGTFYPARGYLKEDLASLDTTTIKALFFERGGEYHPKIAIDQLSAFKRLSENLQEIVLRLFNDYYLERQEELWEQKGREKLALIKNSTSCLLCAEDIGVIPKCVESVLKDLNILNLHVQRMPKSFTIEFEDPSDFPKTAVCMPSNHDTPPLRLWWKRLDEEKRKIYAHKLLRLPGKPPEELAEEHIETIIQAHLDSPAQLAMFVLPDLFALSNSLVMPDPEKTQINDPKNTSNSWSWRSHIYVEELLLAKSFTEKIHGMIKKAKR